VNGDFGKIGAERNQTERKSGENDVEWNSMMENAKIIRGMGLRSLRQAF